MLLKKTVIRFLLYNKSKNKLFTEISCPTEKAKIACDKEHIKVLGNDAEFSGPNTFEYFSVKYL